MVRRCCVCVCARMRLTMMYVTKLPLTMLYVNAEYEAVLDVRATSVTTL